MTENCVVSPQENNPDALATVDSVYHRIAGISKDDGLITTEDAEGNTRLISPREAVAEGVTLYTPDTIRVGTGDRMRFTKSDRERGYVANSVWTVTAVSGDSVTLSDGQQIRVIRPVRSGQSNILTAYAITAHGAQGASETFAIALEGTEGNRKLMAGFESAYVALSRMKQHVQVYTDNRQGWTDAINNAVQKGTAHDVLEPKSDREVMNAERLFSTARSCGTWWPAVPFSVRQGWPGETVLHGLLHPGANIRSRMWHCRLLTVTASQLVSG